MLLEIPIETCDQFEIEKSELLGCEADWQENRMTVHPEMVTGVIDGKNGSCVVGILGFDESKKVLLTYEEFCKRWKCALHECRNPTPPTGVIDGTFDMRVDG